MWLKKRYILEELVGYSYNNKKYNTFTSISVSLVLEKDNLIVIWPVFFISQLG